MDYAWESFQHRKSNVSAHKNNSKNNKNISKLLGGLNWVSHTRKKKKCYTIPEMTQVLAGI